MDQEPQRRWNSWVAMLAAYLMAFQLVFGGLGPASAASFDPAQVLCGQAASGAPGHPDRSPAPVHHSDGCLGGCCATGHGLGPVPIIAALPGRDTAATATPPARSLEVRIARSGYTPRQTRGPPAV